MGIESSIFDITKRMFERGYLYRERTQTDGQPTEYLYWLTLKGLVLVQMEYSLGDVYDYTDPEKRPEGLSHDWKLAQVHVAFKPATTFWEQRQAVLYSPGTKGEPKPDAFFKIGDFYSYLEVERGRQGNYRNSVSEQTRKVDRYISYFDSGQFKEKWSTLFGLTVKNYFVRFVCDNDHLADNFLMRVKHRHRHTNLMRFWATGFHSLIKQPLGHVWRTAYDVGDRAYSLVDKQPVKL